VDGRVCRGACAGLALLLTAVPGVASDCASRAARAVAQNVIVSAADPALRIRVEESLPYVGALRFDLKGIACVERQVFAAVEKGRVRRLFIVQFESILDASDEVYRWKVRTPVLLDGVPYQHNVFAFDTETEIREQPEAETAKTDTFLKACGLALDRELVTSRFARVVGADRRRELIFFYMEPLPPGAGRFADFDDGAPRTPEQRALASALTERSLNAFALLPK
jgi:hypothetical protein